MSTQKPSIFISYSHKDEEEKEALVTQLSVLSSESLFEIWVDDKIGAGGDWEQEINEALASAQIAILLITANFLTSNFILNKEVPIILNRRKQEGMAVIPIIAKSCAWDAVAWLNQMNVRPKNGVPIWSKKGNQDPDYELTQICREIHGLIKQFQKERYRVFISYTQRSDTDKKIAYALQSRLSKRGHEIFIDQRLRAGDSWLEIIDQEIKQSDFLIALLSEDSINSEMVRAEVLRAQEYRQRNNKPQVLPIRVNYHEMLPYAIAANLNSLQYLMWQGEQDTAALAEKIIAAIETNPAKFSQTPSLRTKAAMANDEIRASNESVPKPSPEFDPRILKQLETPGGAVRLRDKFYIEREPDRYFYEEIVKSGKVITIRAPRQMGKTSLLIRGINTAQQAGFKTAFIDLQGFGSDYLTSANRFLREFAELLCRELRVDLGKLDKAWNSDLGPYNKLTYFIEDEILPNTEQQIVLAIDESDTLMQTEFYAPFFGLLRSWYNRATRYPEWEKLSMVLVISTEPYLLIDDPNQSPFNIGLGLELTDFTEQEVQSLNQLHGTVVAEQDFPRLMRFLGGHPYLTRKALYTLVSRGISWAILENDAINEDGAFGDHLRRHHWQLREHPELIDAFQEILKTENCTNEKASYRLLRAGLIRRVKQSYQARCDLYRIYFSEKFA